VDHLNTPRAIEDGTQKVVWRWDNQEPFGDDTPNEDPGNTGTSFSFPMRFPGQYYDAETNTAYNYFRDYDPGIGRYVQSDPIGLLGGIATYAYVADNPVSWGDPRGLMCTAGLGCYTTPAERTLAQSGNYLGYYQLACAGGDAYACYAEHIAANDTVSAHVATWWLKRNIDKVAEAHYQCANVEGILNQIRPDLALAYANYLPSSPADARWPIALDISKIHWDEFAKFGLPPRAFGGTPLGAERGPIMPRIWCPDCRS